MTIKARITELERRRESPEVVPAILHRRKGETIKGCIARYEPRSPAYVFPPAKPRDDNGELAASWIAGCKDVHRARDLLELWALFERSGRGFMPKTVMQPATH